MSSATCHISSALPDMFIVIWENRLSFGRLADCVHDIAKSSVFINKMWASKWALLSVFTSVKAPGFSRQINLAVRSQTGWDGWAECWGMFTVCVFYINRLQIAFCSGTKILHNIKFNLYPNRKSLSLFTHPYILQTWIAFIVPWNTKAYIDTLLSV